MSLRTTYSPQSPWEGLQVTNIDLCLHTVMAIGHLGYWVIGQWLLGYWLLGIYRRFQRDFLVGGGAVERRGIYWGNFPWSNLSWGKKISMKGAQDFLALLKKKTIKNKYEQVFSSESKEQLENEQKLITTHMRWFVPSSIPHSLR